MMSLAQRRSFRSPLWVRAGIALILGTLLPAAGAFAAQPQPHKVKLSPNAAKAAALGFRDYINWPADLDPAKFFPVSKVRPGMEGIGKTVFEGTKIEEFKIVVLGVAHNFYPESDLVWVRVETPRLKDLGVVAGMSGSPVYIDGKMLGAVAYGYSFTREPIAGITPIEEMVRVLNITNDKPHPPSTGAIASNWAQARSVMERWRKQRAFILHGDDARSIGLPDADKIPADGVPIEPLGMALQVSTANPLVLDEANNLLSPYGFHVVSGGGMTGELGSLKRVQDEDNEIYKEKPKIADGAALGVTLMNGSLDLSGVGTITLVDGNRLVAFGHPMFGDGAVDFPMTTAVIFGIMPSIMRPFKLGETVQEIGSVRQDRLPAIGGQLHFTTPKMPMIVHVFSPDMHEKERVFQYGIVPDKHLAPMLAMIGWAESLVSADRPGGPMTLETDLKIHLARGKTLERRDFLSGDTTPSAVTGYDLMSYLGNLLNNPYELVKISKIEINATLRQRLDLGIVVDARLDRDAYRPGETAKLRVWVQQWRKGTSSVDIPIHIPAKLEDGDYSLRLLDGSSREDFEYRLRPELRHPLNADQLIDSLEVSYPSNELYVLLTRDMDGMSIDGRHLPELPGSVQSAMQISAPSYQTVPLTTKKIEEVSKAFPYEVGGSQTLTLTVDRHLPD